MALSDYTYGTVEGVYRRIAWLMPGLAYFAGDTNPTMGQVESMLDDSASEIHARLAKAGYPVSTNTAITSSAPRAQRWLQALNEMGAALAILDMFPATGDPDSGDNKAAARMGKRYTANLDLIAGDALNVLGLTRTTDTASMAYSGSSENEDGEDKLPLFTRGMMDYPASRSLTEDE